MLHNLKNVFVNGPANVYPSWEVYVRGQLGALEDQVRGAAFMDINAELRASLGELRMQRSSRMRSGIVVTWAR